MKPSEILSNGTVKLIIQIAVAGVAVGGLLYEVRDLRTAQDRTTQRLEEVVLAGVRTAGAVERLEEKITLKIGEADKIHAGYERRLDNLEERRRRQP